MGLIDLHFNFKDIFRAPRLALSGKKIWIFIIGNLVGFISYWIMTYLALVLSGLPFGDMVDKYGLYPSISGHQLSLFYWFIYLIGCLIWIVSILFSSTAVCRVTLKQLKGNDFFSGKDAWSYVYKHWHSVVFTPLTIAFIVLFFIAFAAIFGLICKIPFFGPFLYALPLSLIHI